MLKLKKIATSILCVASSTVLAGTMGPTSCVGDGVVVPCAKSAWEFGVQALYLKTNYSGYGFMSSSTSNPTTLGETTLNATETYNEAPYNWAWGFKLEGAYHFNTGNDLNLNWYHVNNTSSTNSNQQQGFIGDIINAIGSGLNFKLNTTLTTKPTWDAVNLEVGQHVHYGQSNNIRFHAGVQYAHIQNEYSSVIIPSVGNPPITLGGLTINTGANLKFNGFGPRIGADYAYNLRNNFSIYAKGATTLLVGQQSFTDTVNISLISPVSIPTLTTTGSTTVIVPQLEAKLGATFTHKLPQGDFSFDAGWMWVNYFNALTNATLIGVLDGFGETKESNAAMQGPFVGVKWVGNVA
jgi:hypothetical protein